MGNVERCCTRLRANAIFRSPASLLIEFMRSLLRNGSGEDVSLWLLLNPKRTYS